ncbi:MAG TPA: phosphatase PAP2 family protein [Bacteroidales bacterium]|nr:phosphatase PAP2 family protein [Bacteroidales bacterium]
MLEKVDQSLFLFLNSFNSPFWDELMWFVSGKLTWLPLYFFVLILIGIKYKKRILIIIPIIVLTITASDQLSVHAFKEVFERLRPCHEPELEGLVHIVRGKCGGEYGFVSSHAANSFAVALLSLALLKKRWYSITIIVWATLVGYSRVYLGVHYPGDVICGALLGIIIGQGFWLLYHQIDRRYLTFDRSS